MKKIIMTESQEKILIKEAQGVPYSAIEKSRIIVDEFLKRFDEMYDKANELETDFIIDNKDKEEDYFRGDLDWEDDFKFEFNCWFGNIKHAIYVYYDSTDRHKAQIDDYGDIDINFYFLRNKVDRLYERYALINRTPSEETIYNIVKEYIYPIIIHELTHDVNEGESEQDYIWLGSCHRLNEGDIREILYVFSDNEINCRISASYALMEDYLDAIFTKDNFRKYKLSTIEIQDLINEVIEDGEDELRVGNMKTLISLIECDCNFKDRDYINRAEKEKRIPYSISYDLFKNDSRLKKNRNLKRLFHQNFPAGCKYVLNFYKKLYERYKLKIRRTCIKAIQDYIK